VNIASRDLSQFAFIDQASDRPISRTNICLDKDRVISVLFDHAASLSSGISEALITTEYGLYVAIPSLLAQALLTRMAKGKLGEMEQASVAFVNGLSKKS
jgi:hypothetical protein